MIPIEIKLCELESEIDDIYSLARAFELSQEPHQLKDLIVLIKNKTLKMKNIINGLNSVS